jgi:hypothetical protein
VILSFVFLPSYFLRGGIVFSHNGCIEQLLDAPNAMLPARAYRPLGIQHDAQSFSVRMVLVFTPLQNLPNPPSGEVPLRRYTRRKPNPPSDASIHTQEWHAPIYSLNEVSL